MELRARRQMRTAAILLAVAAVLGGASPQAGGPPPAAASAQAKPQTPSHFYDVKTEIRVEGVVQSVRFEPRYEGTAAFLILDFEERATKRRFTVEVSPAWFFSQDIHQGERMKILGSLVSSEDNRNVLIARQVQSQGETIDVRDARGFPNWRGGPRQLGKRKRSG